MNNLMAAINLLWVPLINIHSSLFIFLCCCVIALAELNPSCMSLHTRSKIHIYFFPKQSSKLISSLLLLAHQTVSHFSCTSSHKSNMRSSKLALILLRQYKLHKPSLCRAAEPTVTVAKTQLYEDPCLRSPLLNI